MERTIRAMLAVAWCLGMLICTFGYTSKGMGTFRYPAILIILSTVGYLLYLVRDFAKGSKNS